MTSQQFSFFPMQRIFSAALLLGACACSGTPNGSDDGGAGSGDANNGSGGSSDSGGTNGTGGDSESGGSSSTDGGADSGGAMSTGGSDSGGAMSTGGSDSGGSSSGSGASMNSGGIGATGGSSATTGGSAGSSGSGGVCEDGEMRPDDCNVCTCEEGRWVCTEMVCETSICGGFAGQTCDADEYCAYQPEHRCGAADATAMCEPRPDFCTDEYDPVCGCDGNTYGNACEAAAAGTGIMSEGTCSSTG